MKHHRYLIIGGGMTADAAVRGIRELDAQGSIGLISAERDPPYNRPPLSKGLWKGKPLESIWRNTAGSGVELHLGRTVTRLDLSGRRVATDNGDVHTFDKLLLATGGTPRVLPFGGPEVIYFRTLADYRKLHAAVGQEQRFAVIGGGFIGSEIAAALAMAGEKNVSLIFPEGGIAARLFPADLSGFVNDYYRGRGVDVRPGQELVDLLRAAGMWRLTLRDRKTGEEQVLEADVVVAGLGIVPDTSLAEKARLTVDNGIVVDELLRAGHENVYAAGDVAVFHNPALGMRMRVEHEDNANTMGRIAGRNMAGDSTPYYHLPSFYSDLFDLGYEAVGRLDARLEVVADWSEPFKKGVLYYVQEGRVRGVLLWNVWDKVDAARELIAKGEPVDSESLKGRLA